MQLSSKNFDFCSLFLNVFWDFAVWVRVMKNGDIFGFLAPYVFRYFALLASFFGVLSFVRKNMLPHPVWL